MEWIDAKVKLPEDGDRVLLFTPYPIFGNDYSCVGNRESIVACTAEIDNTFVQVFTHWMPLPEKPSH